MEKRAIVIRTVGNPEIAGAIVDAMKRQVIPLDNDELLAVRAELARLKSMNERLETRDGVRQNGDKRRWEATKHDLEEKYGTKPKSAVQDNLLVIYALVSLTIEECGKRLVNRFRRCALWPD